MKLPEDKIIIFFDGVCNFCNGFVNFVIVRDKKNKFLFAPLQSEQGKEFLTSKDLNPDKFDSVIVLSSGIPLQKSDAALEIARNMGFPWFMFYGFKIFPRSFRDFFYKLIAKNRYTLFGKKESCMIPTTEIKAKFLE
ncbi:MAG TPA: thiol-disulfide oxidoreductase DCC family protein [Cytophagaceae bacterium]|jgi:predicted DCC family thiol-disulfide oxidoreductase YuxK|nr:thiol-disulfide oxidoreductase DCC family protein [Cytophagaceae bacterium]